MTTIALVRHGSTDWNHRRLMQGRTDVPISPEGLEQAGSAGEMLRELGHGSHVVTSPLARARDTAVRIAQVLQLAAPTICDALIERDYGRAEGHAVDQVNNRWPGGDFPYAENVDAAAERGAASVSDLPSGSIAVSHGTLIRLTAQRLCGTSFPRIPNGAVLMLTHGAGEWRGALHSPPRRPSRAS